jgi:hypothetical protein
MIDNETELVSGSGSTEPGLRVGVSELSSISS